MKILKNKYTLILIFTCSYYVSTAQNTSQVQLQNIDQAPSKRDIKVEKTRAKIQQFIENHVFLMAGMNGAKQNISTGMYQSKFNYNINDYQNNTYQPGYFVGLRIDQLGKGKSIYDFSIQIHKINTGTNYIDAKNFSPFLGTFSKFKADDNFLLLNMNSHYKKIITSDQFQKKKLYFIIGPSIDIRLSSQSEYNQISYNYRNLIIKGDIGFEFDNQSYYTVFVHYKQPLSSFTKMPINTNLNTFEIGALIKATDLF